MNPHASLAVILAVGSLLIAGTLASAFTTQKTAPGHVKVHFVHGQPAAQPADEPLFPGLPTP